MSATVTLPNKSIKEYADGVDAVVEEGHLVVRDALGLGARTLAIYAPERWASVDLTD